MHQALEHVYYTHRYKKMITHRYKEMTLQVVFFKEIAYKLQVIHTLYIQREF